MTNISDKSRKEDQSTRFTFKNFLFSKIVPFIR